EVGVMMALVAVAARLMHGEVDRALIPVGQLPRESTGELHAPGRFKLRRKRHQHLSREPRIAATRVLRRVPQCRSIACPVGVRPAGELRCQHDLLVKDVVTIGVVVDLARALIADALARAVGRSPRDAAAFSPREDLDVQKILCHRAVRRRAAALMVAQTGRKLKSSSLMRCSWRGRGGSNTLPQLDKVRPMWDLVQPKS